MKKTILLIFGLILLVSIAYAVEEGDYITQQQLDSIDPLTFDLKCRIDVDGINDNNYMTGGRKFVVRTVSCLSTNSTEEPYLIVREPEYVWQSHKVFKMCKMWLRMDNSELNAIERHQFCTNELWFNLIGKFRTYERNIRFNLLQLQTEEDIEIGGGLE